MERDYRQEYKYLSAKKRVEKIKGFYWHLLTYVLVNLLISSVIILGLMKEDNISFMNAITNFRVYSTWVYWGISVVFHWLGTFGLNVSFGKSWEDRKIEDYMKNDKF